MRAPEIDRGMNRSWGTLPGLLRLVGPARTRRMIMPSEKVDAVMAAARGLAQRTAPDGRTLEVERKAAEEPSAPAARIQETVNTLSGALAALTSRMDRDPFLLSVLDPEAVRRMDRFKEEA